MTKEFWFRVIITFVLLWTLGTIYGTMVPVPDTAVISTVVECDPNYEVCGF